jgi:hypothetical protein
MWEGGKHTGLVLGEEDRVREVAIVNGLLDAGLEFGRHG